MHESQKNLEKNFFLGFFRIVHGIHDLSAGRTRTVRVRYAHLHNAGFLDHYKWRWMMKEHRAMEIHI